LAAIRATAEREQARDELSEALAACRLGQIHLARTLGEMDKLI